MPPVVDAQPQSVNKPAGARGRTYCATCKAIDRSYRDRKGTRRCSDCGGVSVFNLAQTDERVRERTVCLTCRSIDRSYRNRKGVRRCSHCGEATVADREAIPAQASEGTLSYVRAPRALPSFIRRARHKGKRLSPSAWLVYLAYCAHTGGTGNSTTRTVEEIATAVGLKPETVKGIRTALRNTHVDGSPLLLNAGSKGRRAVTVVPALDGTPESWGRIPGNFLRYVRDAHATTGAKVLYAVRSLWSNDAGVSWWGHRREMLELGWTSEELTSRRRSLLASRLDGRSIAAPYRVRGLRAWGLLLIDRCSRSVLGYGDRDARKLSPAQLQAIDHLCDRSITGTSGKAARRLPSRPSPPAEGGPSPEGWGRGLLGSGGGEPPVRACRSERQRGGAIARQRVPVDALVRDDTGASSRKPISEAGGPSALPRPRIRATVATLAVAAVLGDEIALSASGEWTLVWGPDETAFALVAPEEHLRAAQRRLPELGEKLRELCGPWNLPCPRRDGSNLVVVTPWPDGYAFPPQLRGR